MSALPPPLPALPHTRPRGLSRGAKIALYVGIPAALLLVIGAVVAFVLLIFGVLKNSEPYRHALAVAQADARVRAALGTPVHDGRFVNGTISTSDDSGSAQFAIPLARPRGRATLFVDARRVDRVWQYRTLRIDLPSGPVDLESPP